MGSSSTAQFSTCSDRFSSLALLSPYLALLNMWRMRIMIIIRNLKLSMLAPILWDSTMDSIIDNSMLVLTMDASITASTMVLTILALIIKCSIRVLTMLVSTIPHSTMLGSTMLDSTLLDSSTDLVF